ncbi:hypothetical protein [Desmospora profundinema]|uniref:Uncharacterized protein n=1 Tax=Desmospora profundinema TaxID=1571184 RepID=A0ABU1IKS8_9BACL|nr:hypothetical protein [Desmospora profundinema]MDR6225373.1 hypothetical protein [Desmospora profundinema]
MAKTGGDYDLIVISKDQAGLEAAKEAVRLGKTALILKLNPGAIASVMCSTSNGSPGGLEQEGVEADRLLMVEDRETGTLSFRMERLDVDTRHSVYIFQSEQEEPSAVNPTREFEPGPTPSLPPVEESASLEEENELIDSDYERTSGYGFTSYTYSERDQLKETLRDRHIHARRKLLYRPFSGGRKEKPERSTDKPIFREREMDFRKRMTREYRKPSVKEMESRPTQTPSAKMSPKPRFQPSSPSARTEEPQKRQTGNTAEPPVSKERRQPFSSSVIPMDQSRWKRSARKKEKKEEPKKTPSPNIPGSMVWEANGDVPKADRRHAEEVETSSKDHRENRKRSSPSPPSNVYQPFQRPKETPSRTQGPLRSSGEAPFTRKDRTTSNNRDLPATSGYGQDWSGREQTGPLSRKQARKEETRPERESSSPPKRDGQQSFMNQEAARHILRNTTQSSQEQGLKRDSIDIEDPYGQSYEDFMEPFHGSSQDQQLEKRKLALRGLHNLINNLG